MIHVIDDALSPLMFNRLRNAVVTGDLPFFYISNSAYSEQPDERCNQYSFAHVAFVDGRENSQLSPVAEMCILAMLDKTNVTFEKLIRIRIGLITKVGDGATHDPHVDSDAKHMTGLLYLNDSDGDTVIYNERFDFDSNLTSREYAHQVIQDRWTIEQRISPKENRLVIMSGDVYHSSSKPTTVPARYAMNFNFV